MADMFGAYENITPDATDARHVYWAITTWLDNFNAADVYLRKSALTRMRSIPNVQLILIRRISIALLGAAAGIYVNRLVFPPSTDSSTLQYEFLAWTTAAAKESKQISLTQALSASSWINMTTGYNYFLEVEGMSGFGANDDLKVLIEGELWYTTPMEETQLTPTPVSLEAYKWPLRRL